MILKPEPINANKRFTTEEKSITKANHFVQHTPLNKNIKDFGLEYYLDVTRDVEYINKIYEKNLYNHSEESQQEFYSALYSIMNVNGQRNNEPKTTAVDNAGKCFPLGTIAIKGIRKICGKCLEKKYKEEAKDEKKTQEDIFILKLRSLLELGKIRKSQYQYNLNSLRLVIEKIIEEFLPALDVSIFQKQDIVINLLVQLRKFTMDKLVHKAILLSYKLLKIFQDRHQMSHIENRQEVAKKIQDVLLPYVRLMELDGNLISQTKANPSLIAYYKIKGMLSKPEVIAMIKEFPAPKTTHQAQEQFRVFLREEVNLNEHLRKAAARNNQTTTEQVEFKFSEPSSPKEPINSQSPTRISRTSPNKIIQDDYRKDSSPSIRDIQYEDLVEGVNAFPTDIYDLNLEKKSSQKKLQNKDYESTTGFTAVATQIMNQKGQEPDLLGDGQETQKKQRKQGGSPKKFLQGLLGNKGVTPSNRRNQKLEDGEEFQKEKQPQNGLLNLAPCNEDDSPIQPNNEQPNISSSPIYKAKEEIALEIPGMSGHFDGDRSPNEETPFEQVLRLGYDEKSKWEKVCNTPAIKIEKIRTEESPILLIRAWAFVQGFSPKEIFDQIYDTENRAKWDTVTMGLSVVDKISETCHVIYFYVKTPIGISERDFVQIRNFKFDYPEKDTIVMTFQSQIHAKAPPMKGRIRAETNIAGYIIKPSTKAPNSTDICIISQVDIKGNIPKIIVNMASGKAPAEWVNKLVKACERTRKEKRG